MTCFRLITAILLFSGMNSAFAYGTSKSTHSCDKPLFSAFQPAANKYLQSFSEFSFITTGNAVESSIAIHLSFNGSENKMEFDSKELQITKLKNGHLVIKGKLDKPFEHGFVRIDMYAHSKPGCETHEGYLARVY